MANHPFFIGESSAPGSARPGSSMCGASNQGGPNGFGEDLDDRMVHNASRMLVLFHGILF